MEISEGYGFARGAYYDDQAENDRAQYAAPAEHMVDTIEKSAPVAPSLLHLCATELVHVARDQSKNHVPSVDHLVKRIGIQPKKIPVGLKEPIAEASKSVEEDLRKRTLQYKLQQAALHPIEPHQTYLMLHGRYASKEVFYAENLRESHAVIRARADACTDDNKRAESFRHIATLLPAEVGYEALLDLTLRNYQHTRVAEHYLEILNILLQARLPDVASSSDVEKFRALKSKILQEYEKESRQSFHGDRDPNPEYLHHWLKFFLSDNDLSHSSRINRSSANILQRFCCLNG